MATTDKKLEAIFESAVLKIYYALNDSFSIAFIIFIIDYDRENLKKTQSLI